MTLMLITGYPDFMNASKKINFKPWFQVFKKELQHYSSNKVITSAKIQLYGIV
jgi:hypothetical protein